jgi:hypothetical protein
MWLAQGRRIKHLMGAADAVLPEGSDPLQRRPNVAKESMTLALGLLFALACAFVTNLGFFFKYRGANAAAAVSMRHPLTSAKALFASKWFSIGMVVALFSWLLHVGALAVAPMSLVQVALSGGVVLIAVMADRIFGFEVGPRQWFGLCLMAAGLITLALTLPALHGPHSHFSQAAMISFEAGLFGLGGLLIMGPRMGGQREHHGVMLAAAAGILFGVSDTAIKALTGIVGAHGVLAIPLSPWFAVAALASVIAFYASARGLQVGDAVPVIAVTGTAANIAGIAGGILVFGDPMPGSASGIVIQSLAFVLVIVASALMPAPARSSGLAPSLA